MAAPLFQPPSVNGQNKNEKDDSYGTIGTFGIYRLSSWHYRRNNTPFGIC
jgi:hypothetical protein